MLKNNLFIKFPVGNNTKKLITKTITKSLKRIPVSQKKNAEKTFSVQKNPNLHQLHMNHYVSSSFRQSY